MNEYSHDARALQPMAPAILSKNIVFALCQLLPLPLNLVPPPIFYYRPEHIFVLDKTLFT
jgi:hypothetical protein